MAINTVFTIGHSTHSLEDYVRLLRQHDGPRVADVRSIPKSRRVPHFSRDVLKICHRQAWRGAACSGLDSLESAQFHHESGHLESGHLRMPAESRVMQRRRPAALP